SSRRRHTRSKRDWSSDVCSSDLGEPDARGWATTRATRSGRPGAGRAAPAAAAIEPNPVVVERARQAVGATEGQFGAAASAEDGRSEERRVGKEGRCGRGGWAAMD